LNQIRALLLAAGMGTRLLPLTRNWPKCLMPIARRPLLEHWLCILRKSGIKDVLVNIHHHRHAVELFLSRPQFDGSVSRSYEPKLLGTAGTVLRNIEFLKDHVVLLIHADNWCQCNFSNYLDFHLNHRPPNTLITMMTFRTNRPSECGIVTLNRENVVTGFYEKVGEPPGNLANGAVYLLEPEVIDWISKRPFVVDFSRDVLPNFLGLTATWENKDIHRDIGLRDTLIKAQIDPHLEFCWPEVDEWQKAFQENSIHAQLNN